jgi:hypothetical protein
MKTEQDVQVFLDNAAILEAWIDAGKPVRGGVALETLLKAIAAGKVVCLDTRGPRNG